MRVPNRTKTEKRLILTLGRHQDSNFEQAKNLGELAETIDSPVPSIQRGVEKALEADLVKKDRRHPDTIIRLTEDGEEAYEHYEALTEVVPGEEKRDYQ